jgi:hypothetical protein
MPRRPKQGQHKGVSGPSRARSSDPSVRKPAARAEELNPPGRPTRYSDALAEQLCNLISAGVPIRVASRSLGIARSTLYEWRDAGRRGLDPYVVFESKLERALSRAETSLTLNLVRAAQKDWRAAAWWLERRHPERYGAKQTMRVEKAPTEMTEAELDAAIAKHGYVRALELIQPDGEDTTT